MNITCVIEAGTFEENLEVTITDPMVDILDHEVLEQIARAFMCSRYTGINIGVDVTEMEFAWFDLRVSNDGDCAVVIYSAPAFKK